MIIDGHAHACGEYLTVDNIQKKLKKNNTDSVVLVPGEPNSKTTYNLKDRTIKNPGKEIILSSNKMTRILITLTQLYKTIPASNEYIYNLKQNLPGKIKQFFWITKKQKDELDEKYNQMKFEGVKLHQCWENFEINSGWFRDICEWTASKKLPVFIHMYKQKDVKELINLIKNNKKNIFIIAQHFGLELFLNENLKIFDNIYFDMSNTYFVSEYKNNLVLKHFGAGKLLMGSDTPYGRNALEKCIQRVDSLNITESEKDKILGNNLNNILKG